MYRTFCTGYLKKSSRSSSPARSRERFRGGVKGPPPIPLESNASAQLNGARSGVFGGLQAVDGPEPRSAEAQVGNAVVRMIEQIRSGSPQAQGDALFIAEGPIQRERDHLRARPDHRADR